MKIFAAHFSIHAIRPGTGRSSILAIALVAVALIAPVPGEGQAPGSSEERAAIVTSVQGLESRNGPIQIRDDVLVTGPISARNGAISVGARSEVGGVDSRNGRISIGAGATVSGAVATRNGIITLERGASVARGVESRNGRIDIAEEVRVGGTVEARNGAVNVGSASRIGGAVSSRNGTITLAPGAWVGSRVTARNGAVRMNDAHVVGNVDLRRGDLVLSGRSTVEGDVILLMADEGWFSRLLSPWSDDWSPEIRIDAGVRIGGRLIVDERARVIIAPGAVVPEPELFSGREAWERLAR